MRQPYNPTERIYRVKSKISGEVFFASSAHRRIVDGYTFIGVSRSQQINPERINWVRLDHVMELPE
jgi:hypothetical protein